MPKSITRSLVIALSLTAVLTLTTPAAARATRETDAVAASVREQDPGERLQRWFRTFISRFFGVSTTADPSIPVPAPTTT